MSTEPVVTATDLIALGPHHLLRGNREGAQPVLVVTRDLGDGDVAYGVLDVEGDAHTAQTTVERWGPLIVLARPPLAVPPLRERAVDLLASTGVLDTIFTDRTHWLPMEREDAEAAVDLLIDHGLIGDR